MLACRLAPIPAFGHIRTREESRKARLCIGGADALAERLVKRIAEIAASEAGTGRGLFSFMPGSSPLVNSTPADSSAARMAAKVRGFGSSGVCYAWPGL